MHTFLLCSGLLLAAPPDLETWPGFLYSPPPSLTATTLPLQWSPTENVAWRTALPGYGQSSPVVWNGTVFVTSIEGDNKETNHVVALRLSDGAEVWRKSFASSTPVANSLYVSRAAPTPTVDLRHVYAFFESGDIVALTHAGDVAWQRSLTKDYGPLKAEFGLAASVAQDEASVFLLVEHDGPSYLLALDKETGETRWKVPREARISWSSPMLLEIDGVPQVVINSVGSVDSYAPETGDLLWSAAGLGGNTVASPQLAGTNMILVGASPGRDGKNADLARGSNLALRLEREGQTWKPTTAWQLKGPMSSFASPIAHKDYAYWINRAGVMTCIDIRSGEEMYSERLEESCWATPLVVEDRVYCCGKDGVTTVIAAGPTFKKLAVNRLWESESVVIKPAIVEKESTPERRAAAANFAAPVQYGAAAIEGSLLIRTGAALYCLRNEVK